MRRYWVILHRWLGLASASFLVVVGLTGSLLAFLPELNRAVTPALFLPASTGPSLDPATVAERVQGTLSGVRVRGVFLHDPRVAIVGVVPRRDPNGEPSAAAAFDQVFVNRHTGEILGWRKFGDLSEGWLNLMPFVYRLHYNLALGKTGMWILGITALVWTIDCFIGLWLTLPMKRASASASGRSALSRQTSGRFVHRWAPAWRVKWPAPPYRLQFDLHRATGLWLWFALLIFAWSSVHMNLHDSVYAPVTRLFLDYPPRSQERTVNAPPSGEPRLDWRQAQRVGQRLITAQAADRGFAVLEPVALWIDRSRGTYRYVVRSSLDFQDRRGRTWVSFDADSGDPIHVSLPVGQHSGHTLTHWLVSLHEANVFGWPYRVFVAILGLATAGLSVTGVALWWMKRRARGWARHRRTQVGNG